MGTLRRKLDYGYALCPTVETAGNVLNIEMKSGEFHFKLARGLNHGRHSQEKLDYGYSLSPVVETAGNVLNIEMKIGESHFKYSSWFQPRET
jgi:hypothetical protein